MLLFAMKILPISALLLMLPAFAEASPRVYEIWETNPAPNNGSNWESTKADAKPKSYDKDWEQWSYPLGNGFGARTPSVFRLPTRRFTTKESMGMAA